MSDNPSTETAAGASASTSSSSSSSSSNAPDKRGGLDFLVTPEPVINYNFIVTAYTICALICALLYCLEKYNVLEGVKGYWIVFSPFCVMVPWSVWMKVQVDRLAVPSGSGGKTKSD